MGIDKINPVNNYNGINKLGKTDSLKNTNSTDSIDISTEAIMKAESNKIMDIVNSTPDVRKDKIAEIKEKLKDPNYINDKIISKLSDEIIDTLKI
jgi:negative regulator of flagellin synthesis FlgM